MKTDTLHWTLADLHKFEARRFIPFSQHKHSADREIKLSRMHSVAEVFEGDPDYDSAEYRIRVEPVEDAKLNLNAPVACRQVIYKFNIQ